MSIEDNQDTSFDLHYSQESGSYGSFSQEDDNSTTTTTNSVEEYDITAISGPIPFQNTEDNKSESPDMPDRRLKTFGKATQSTKRAFLHKRKEDEKWSDLLHDSDNSRLSPKLASKRSKDNSDKVSMDVNTYFANKKPVKESENLSVS